MMRDESEYLGLERRMARWRGEKTSNGYKRKSLRICVGFVRGEKPRKGIKGGRKREREEEVIIGENAKESSGRKWETA